jgi:hypothetical protein
MVRSAGETKEWMRKNLPSSLWQAFHRFNLQVRRMNGKDTASRPRPLLSEEQKHSEEI